LKEEKRVKNIWKKGRDENMGQCGRN